MRKPQDAVRLLKVDIRPDPEAVEAGIQAAKRAAIKVKQETELLKLFRQLDSDAKEALLEKLRTIVG